MLMPEKRKGEVIGAEAGEGSCVTRSLKITRLPDAFIPCKPEFESCQAAKDGSRTKTGKSKLTAL